MAQPQFEYRLVPLHCTIAGAVTKDSTECVDAAADDGWRVVPGTVHQFGTSWRVLMEREEE